MIYDNIIIGGGAAGLIAAIESYHSTSKTLVLEKMHKPALKLRISGKGRCNITNSANIKDFIARFGKNGKFLRNSFSQFFNDDLLKYLDNLGVQYKLERGGRYFTKNDDALEVVYALLDNVKALNIPINLNSDVQKITKNSDGIFEINVRQKNNQHKVTDTEKSFFAKKVLIATGGKSYPKTGSSGTGFKFAMQLGHTVTPINPSLIPLETKKFNAKALQGLSLKNISVSTWCENKKINELFGEMVFTEFGISGPIILSLSRDVVHLINENKDVYALIDFKPALEHNILDKRLIKEINNNNKQNFTSLLKQLLPRKIIPTFIERLEIPEDKKLNQLTSKERKKIRLLLKEFKLDITGYKSIDFAIVTSGGVHIKEINPKTLESKIVENLYFAGEVIDIDADTGGYNLQAAFSTGWLAGQNLRT